MAPGARSKEAPPAPRLLYGTAWKEDRTAALVRQALEAGFRGIDTANQRKHYHEAGVGEALGQLFAAGTVRREDLFLQTKFTYRDGQDHRLPYDSSASIAQQVDQSFASSLDHLGLDALDSYVLHGPSTYPGLADADWQAWGAMEDLQRAGRTRLLGVSNILAGQLEELYARASVKPAIVQNRTFTRPHADREVREFCRRSGIVYQGFSLLTAIRGALAHPSIVAIAQRLERTPAQVILRHALHHGIVVLTGTTSLEHLRHDLELGTFDLAADEVVALDRLLAF